MVLQIDGEETNFFVVEDLQCANDFQPTIDT